MPDLADGESTEMQGSGKKPYLIKNTGGVYSCSCPAWRNQSLAIEQRTCKHLRKLRGDDAEKQRVGSAMPAPKSTKEKTEGPPLLLAHNWQNDVNLADWWMSEKLDGVRAYWDGQQFLSRQGKQFHAPDWFTAGLPNSPLDGELWMDRKAFQRTVSIVRRQDKSDHWKKIRYMIFDAPALTDPFEQRIKYINQCVDEIGSKYLAAHQQERCKNVEHLREELQRVEALGGEGLMLREPGSAYEIGRSTTLYKVKTFHDAEAVVIDHSKGKGRHKGRLGALVVQLPDGTEFSVGTGLKDKERENPPAVGSTITFRYQELSDDGVPRFPTYVRLVDAGTPPADSPSTTPTKKTTKKTTSKKATAKKTSGKSTAKAPAKPSTTISTDNVLTRYYELEDGKSAKFWEITKTGLEVTVRYGRIGTNGQTNTKSFPDDAKAQAHADKLIDQKTSKGYIETERPD